MRRLWGLILQCKLFNHYYYFILKTIEKVPLTNYYGQLLWKELFDYIFFRSFILWLSSHRVGDILLYLSSYVTDFLILAFSLKKSVNFNDPCVYIPLWYYVYAIQAMSVHIFVENRILIMLWQYAQMCTYGMDIGSWRLAGILMCRLCVFRKCRYVNVFSCFRMRIRVCIFMIITYMIYGTYLISLL